MTGKEALDDYKYFGKIKGESITSNHTTPSTFRNKWRQKYFEEIEEVNLRADMLCAWNDELENKLSKYEKACEIFMRLLKIRKLNENEKELFEQEYQIYAYWLSKWLTKEEYELLEELMKSEKRN